MIYDPYDSCVYIIENSDPIIWTESERDNQSCIKIILCSLDFIWAIPARGDFTIVTRTKKFAAKKNDFQIDDFTHLLVVDRTGIDRLKYLL